MRYGYARVSERDMNLATQLEELTAYGVDAIIEEKITGVAKKKKLNDLVSNVLQPGDSLIVTRMDRLGRNAVQMLQLVEELQAKGVAFIILDLNVDTSTITGKFFVTVMSAYAEMERSILKEKQRAGIAVAKKNGVHLGRPKRYTDRNKALVHALDLYAKKEHTVKEICAITKVSKASLYRILAEKVGQ